MELEIRKKGKALSALSALLIVYILADGSISGEGSLTFLSVEFGRIWVIKFSVIFFLCYLAFRYWMALNKPWLRFRDNTIKATTNLKIYDDYLTSLIHEDVEKNISHGIQSEIREDTMSIGSNRLLFRNQKYLIKIEYKHRNQSKKLNKWLKWHEFWALGIKTLFKNEDFWEIIMPWCLFVLAFLLLIYEIVIYLKSCLSLFRLI